MNREGVTRLTIVASHSTPSGMAVPIVQEEVRLMKPFWLPALAALIVTTILAAPSEAQQGKGGGGGGKGGGNGGGGGAGKGGGFTPPGKSSAQSSGPGHSVPARPFDHPEKQPGVVKHPQKLNDATA